VYETHADILTPPDETVIWRYMNMERLLALLSTTELFLTRLDGFPDPWEGVWPKSFVDALQSAGGLQKDFVKNLQQTFYVSCWHASAHESAALWHQYSGVAGFAVRSTIGRLKNSLDPASTFFIGSVVYADYEGGSHGAVNALKPPFMKRKSFEHEREVRVVQWKPENLNFIKHQPAKIASHASVAVDLGALIDTLFISPTSPPWLVPHISRFLDVFGVAGVSVIRSTLYDPYIF
jgi:hypothetical protein